MYLLKTLRPDFTGYFDCYLSPAHKFKINLKYFIKKVLTINSILIFLQHNWTKTEGERNHAILWHSAPIKSLAANYKWKSAGLKAREAHIVEAYFKTSATDESQRVPEHQPLLDFIFALFDFQFYMLCLCFK